jgi:hypothetical protein
VLLLSAHLRVALKSRGVGNSRAAHHTQQPHGQGSGQKLKGRLRASITQGVLPWTDGVAAAADSAQSPAGHSPHTAVLLCRGTSHTMPEQKFAASDMSSHMPSGGHSNTNTQHTTPVRQVSRHQATHHASAAGMHTYPKWLTAPSPKQVTVVLSLMSWGVLLLTKGHLVIHVFHLAFEPRCCRVT